MNATTVTPSMRATSWYFLIVAVLFDAQVLLGIVTAHYAVEGQGLYGLPFVGILPLRRDADLAYAARRALDRDGVARRPASTSHPCSAGASRSCKRRRVVPAREPRRDRRGLVRRRMARDQPHDPRRRSNFWFGHQGYEYVDLGRFWQIYLFVGLLLWVALVLRGSGRRSTERQTRSLLFLVVVATVAIGLLFGGGTAVRASDTHISIMEYWRWWVVHLWVEGVFEVFATAIVSALFVRMGLVRVSVATTSVLVATIIFLGGGVLGTFHHLYWSGTPIGVLAVGSVFSALEVVPLVVVGFEAYSRAKHEGLFEWQKSYHWPFMFFGAVLVWNLIGAGLFGFLINPPLALYYMQGLNTTATHGHAALFGVYGMLGSGSRCSACAASRTQGAGASVY